jgi:predicted transcriptional regulator
LEIVWQRNGATVQDVLAEMNENADSPLAYTTILATLQELEKSGWLTHEPAADNNRRYIYRATRSRSGAIGGALQKFADTFLGGSKTLLFQHFVDDTDLSEEELAEIKRMIGGERRKEKGEKR